MVFLLRCLKESPCGMRTSMRNVSLKSPLFQIAAWMKLCDSGSRSSTKNSLSRLRTRVTRSTTSSHVDTGIGSFPSTVTYHRPSMPRHGAPSI